MRRLHRSHIFEYRRHVFRALDTFKEESVLGTFNKLWLGRFEVASNPCFGLFATGDELCLGCFGLMGCWRHICKCMYFVVVRITNGCVNRMKLSEGRAGDMVRCGSMGRVDGMVQESKEVI